ncbi:ABC transporter substrate-binding protein [Sphingomonas nostoxanthinifaciens]|uniref:ABC transporter substrate-binding protein n=1 Tax=Sphingomonas nostoxanthinifaciens TaxID=2872652 RepID=UPI001CC1DD3D|nr:ABC transporter substrate-binding protein [Sphingomonas nostoxanthinifaciens]UAK23608.1 ABC transporter substrate-binding protein [Sphingomonas nostoxanthinifaciens]
MQHPSLLPIFAAAVAIASPAHAADEAAQRIGAYDDAVIAIMKQKLAAGARADRFESVVRSYYDMPGIAALVIGPGWSSASAADRNAAIAALTRHSAVSLARNFKSYDGEKFAVDPTVATRGPNRIVKATINGTVLLYQLHQAEGTWKIVDVVSGGVSQLAVQRSDLASTVASGGAAGLAKRLQQVDAAAK